MSNNVCLNEYCIHWNMSNAFTLLIIYDRIDLTPYACIVYLLLRSNLSIQDGVGKLNGDLLQPFGIRYEV